jgi:hypothetical protein
MKRGRLVAGDQATHCESQPKLPCADCPFARTAIPGWLGDVTIEDFLLAAHGESRLDCHTLIGPQCAGAAIYRANVCKLPRDKSFLVLEPNDDLVFSSAEQFREHHET